MTNEEQKLREFATKQIPLSKELKKEVLYNQIQQAKQDECLSDLTALISEGYVSKEKVGYPLEFIEIARIYGVSSPYSMADELEHLVNQEVEKRIKERIGSIESINYLLLDTALKCPHCGGYGFTVVPNYYTGEPEQEQCRWCWELELYRSRLTNDSQKTEGGTK